jgi:hypothetical protein
LPKFMNIPKPIPKPIISVNKGGAENFDLPILRFPGMVVSGKLFRRRKGHFKRPRLFSNHFKQT